MKLPLRKLLLAPYYLATVAVDTAGTALRRFLRPKPSPKPKFAVSAGISVVIPERGNKEMLRRCLLSLKPACAALGEDTQVIVVVSDARADTYNDLTQAFEVQWIFRSKPLWFVEAISIGIAAAKYDWVYMLNSDMVVDAAALHEVAKWRSPSVFAIASQIYFQDGSRRREETGLTEIRNAGGLVEIRDIPPENDDRVRNHIYAGGGSSLFQRKLLARFIRTTRTYAPFYWEDVEWSIQAARKGFQVLFCPQSKVWHAHRSTNLKYFAPDEIERIFRRNRLRFQLRTALPPDARRTIFGSIARLDEESFRSMLQVTSIAATLSARLHSYCDPPFELGPAGFEIHYGRPRRPEKPLIMIASPYCVYPPAHGGARRIHELVRRLALDFDIVLVSDESEHYSTGSVKYFQTCHAVYLLSGRKPRPGFDGRIDRILTHSHATLAEMLRAMIILHNPDVVQIEFVELAKLVDIRDHRPWIVTLHDVLLDDVATETSRKSKADEFELRYIRRFDAVMACSAEDCALLPLENVHIVHNGANVTPNYSPSPQDAPILFLGPFRYSPNLAGIIEFLGSVYPAIRGELPAVQLWILGGDDGRVISARHTCFDQPGVTVFDFIEDVHPFLQQCSITINPDRNVRGSSLKVIESLAAGRVCVSTPDGARGLRAPDLMSLVIVDESEFAAQIIKLLVDVEYRHRLEAPAEALHQFSWQRSSEIQARIYRSLLSSGCSTPGYAFRREGTPAR